MPPAKATPTRNNPGVILVSSCREMSRFHSKYWEVTNGHNQKVPNINQDHGNLN